MYLITQSVYLTLTLSLFSKAIRLHGSLLATVEHLLAIDTVTDGPIVAETTNLAFKISLGNLGLHHVSVSFSSSSQFFSANIPSASKQLASPKWSLHSTVLCRCPLISSLLHLLHPFALQFPAAKHLWETCEG